LAPSADTFLAIAEPIPPVPPTIKIILFFKLFLLDE
jgi:hypothetical protein